MNNLALRIMVAGRRGIVKYDTKRKEIALDKKPLLWAVAKVVADMREVRAIRVDIKEATFSSTRQVVALVNTLAWVSGIKVNGKRQLHARYSGKPNITKSKS